MRSLFAILRPASAQLPWMLGGIILSVAVIAANTLLMAVSGWFITSMAVAGAAKVSFNFFFASATIRALAILRTVGRYAERLVTHEAAFRILAELRVWLFRSLIPLAPAGLEKYASGDLAGRMRADIDSLESVYLRIIAPIATGAAAILLATAFTSIWSNSAAIILLTMLTAAGCLLPILSRRVATVPGQASTQLAGELRSQVTQGLQGAEELLLLGATEHHARRVEALSGAQLGQQVRLADIGGLTSASLVFISGITLALLCLALIPEVLKHQTTGPQMVMLLLFAAAAFEATAPMALSLQLLPAAAEAVKRIRELADAPVPMPEPETSAMPEGAAISLNSVTMGYDTGRTVLDTLSLSIPPGERIAVTGQSGSGKSSLLELLLRFRPYSGSVTIGGAELKDIPPDRLASVISALPQQPHLFNSSIRENILLGRQCSEERLNSILSDCCLDVWIATLPMGLDTPVGESGRKVSGGEAKRIALARALVVETPIILMDEPTEGLDAATEEAVVNNLKERLNGRTVIVATHRPACMGLSSRFVHLEERNCNGDKRS